MTRPAPVVVLGLWLSGSGASAQTVVNAQLTTQPAGSLAQTFESLKAGAQAPAWIGYSVPATGASHTCCDCWDGGQGRRGCRLEDDRGVSVQGKSADEGPASLEAPATIQVLWRVAQGDVSRLRVFSAGCPLDAGGRPVHWLTDVKPSESLALLVSLVDRTGETSRDLANAAVMAVALHADAGADALLERFAGPGRPFEVRKDALFWMGVARGRRGFETLRRAARDDADARVREHVMFALTLSREPEALDVLVASAHDDPSAHVRGQALFWLAQKAGQRAASAITKALEDDPETEVKTKAVFALSQLPRDQGVPLLIQQAKSNRNRQVRKQALFWLGQSGDPRALALFEEILKP